ncbi:MFS transporter [Actinoplanes sp. NPDC020271]|uniref:MFS transporter n=1 Tax=Actinoplanes sp. NPDC020271 TaxID=3363896 RepID=UPI0037966B5A
MTQNALAVRGVVSPGPAAAHRAWLGPAAGAFVVAWGANMFAALLQTYRADLSEVQVLGLFGAYAVGLIPALLIMARLSDRLGRRRVLVAALVLAALGSATILLAHGAFAVILTGRIIVGISAGAAFGPATAWIKELSDATGPAGDGPRRAAIALTAGFAAGPLLSGAVVQWLPSPQVTAYVMHLVLVAVALPFVTRAPEPATTRGTVDPGDADRGSLRSVLTSRIFLTAVVPTAPWVFGAATVALAALPVLVPLGHYGPIGSGVAAAVTLGTGIAVQPWARRLARRSTAAPFRAGVTAVIAGMLVAAATAATASPVLLLTSTVLLGSAYGFLLVSGLQLMERLARRDDIATLVAVFYALTYVGFAFPVLVQELGGLWSPALVLTGASGLGLLAMVATLFAWPPLRGVAQLRAGHLPGRRSHPTAGAVAGDLGRR